MVTPRRDQTQIGLSLLLFLTRTINVLQITMEETYADHLISLYVLQIDHLCLVSVSIHRAPPIYAIQITMQAS